MYLGRIVVDLGLPSLSQTLRRIGGTLKIQVNLTQSTSEWDTLCIMYIYFDFGLFSTSILLANHALFIVEPFQFWVVPADVCLKRVLGARDHLANWALVFHADVHMLAYHVADDTSPELDELAARFAHISSFCLHHVLMDKCL